MPDTILVTIHDPQAVPAVCPPTAASRACRVSQLKASDVESWNDYVDKSPRTTLFHTIAWRDAVRDSFGHEPIYLVALREQQLVGILPMFLVASRLAGRMLVSVPYGVGGGIVADDEDAVSALFDTAKQIANERRCTTIDLRSEYAVVPELATVDRYVGFTRELPADPEEVLNWLPRKARAAARNARDKYKLTVSFGDEHLSDVWRLYSMSMRRLASLSYPKRFLAQLIEQTPGNHWVSVVRWQGRIVAGLVTFLFKDRVMPYFVGSTDEARRCSAINYIYLTAMQRGVASGYRVFDFGRTRRDNRGSYDFKRFQGFEPKPLGYQCYTAEGCQPPDLSPTSPKFRLARKVWSHLPLSITQALGARIARHIPG